MNKDLFFMQEALDEAKKGLAKGEVPVGAVLTFNNEIIAKGHNSPISSNDPSCHAEVNTIREAASILKNYRLEKTSLYVTLEPCSMCCGLLIHSRIENLIFAALDPKSGAVMSNASLLDADFINHKVNYSQGPLASQSSELLKSFFRARRS
tara:strand:+ start:303 stop:755 length:453 start_codon:yes stop_codon:yes gene_type:complete